MLVPVQVRTHEELDLLIPSLRTMALGGSYANKFYSDIPGSISRDSEDSAPEFSNSSISDSAVSDSMCGGSVYSGVESAVATRAHSVSDDVEVATVAGAQG